MSLADRLTHTLCHRWDKPRRLFSCCCSRIVVSILLSVMVFLLSINISNCHREAFSARVIGWHVVFARLLLAPERFTLPTCAVLPLGNLHPTPRPSAQADSRLVEELNFLSLLPEMLSREDSSREQSSSQPLVVMYLSSLKVRGDVCIS